MKRQHPTDPNLFWCPKCEGYKTRGEFGDNKSREGGMSCWCKRCKNLMETERYKTLDHDTVNFNRRVYLKKNPQVGREWRKRTENHNPGTAARAAKRSKAKAVHELKDHYLISNMKRDGIIIAPETIELKRQQITKIRELRKIMEAIRNESVSLYFE